MLQDSNFPTEGAGRKCIVFFLLKYTYFTAFNWSFNNPASLVKGILKDIIFVKVCKY